jgi:hypothetical protein
MTELAKAAASGVVARPSPRRRADGRADRGGRDTPRDDRRSLSAPPIAQPSESITCRLVSGSRVRPDPRSGSEVT